jgi:hypothetical protein
VCAIIGLLGCQATEPSFDADAVDLTGVWNFIETRTAFSGREQFPCLFYTQVTLTPYAFADTSLDYLATFNDSATFSCGGQHRSSPYYFAGTEYVVRHARDSIIIQYDSGVLDLFTGRLTSPTSMNGLGHHFAGQTWRAGRPGHWQ